MSKEGSLEQKECLKELKSKFISQVSIFDSGYEIIELIGQNSNLNLSRLLNILNSYPNMNLQSCSSIYKFKNKKHPEFQLYILPNGETLQIVLIDIFHLGLPAEYFKKNGQKVKPNIDAMYKKRKNYNQCISSILS